MPLIRLEHFLVLTDDLDATRDFYCLGLGLAPGPRPPFDFLGLWIYAGDVPCIHVAQWDSYRDHCSRKGKPLATRSAGTGAVDHIAFHGVDGEAIAAQLNSRGIPVVRSHVPGTDLHQLFVVDPNGVQIEINCRGRGAGVAAV